jgi:hypothetical protein
LKWAYIEFFGDKTVYGLNLNKTERGSKAWLIFCLC